MTFDVVSVLITAMLSALWLGATISGNDASCALQTFVVVSVGTVILHLPKVRASDEAMRGPRRPVPPAFAAFVALGLVSWPGPALGEDFSRTARQLLFEQTNPNAAVSFLRRLQRDADLSMAERDTVDGWLAAARDFAAHEFPPNDARSPNDMFRIGALMFKASGEAVAEPSDDLDADERERAASYLLPFVLASPGDPRVPEALLMLADIRAHASARDGDAAAAFYLGELISMVPHTPIAAEAYARLEMLVTSQWTGSAGMSLPNAVRIDLEHRARLAGPRGRGAR